MNSGLQIFIAHPSHCLTDHLPHGDGLIAMNFLRHLAMRGHTLHVAAPLVELASALPPNIHLYPMQTRVRTSPAEQSFAFRMEYAWRVRQLFDRLHREHHMDVIHQLNPAVLGLSMLLYGRGVPVVAGPVWPAWDADRSNRGVHSRRIKRRVRQAIVRANFLRTDVALVPTRASARVLEKAGVPAGVAQQLPIGVDVETFRPNFAVEPQQPTILFLANLQKRKGVYVLLEAFEHVFRAVPSVQLHIAGSGAERNGLEQRIASMPCRDSVKLLGNIARENVVSTLQRSTVYCLPSFGEPFGMSALEAMACGLPLVTTEGGGLADLVRPGGGLQVPMRDSVALAGALTRLLQDVGLRRRMAKFNRELVLREYAWPRVTERLENIYSRAIAAQTESSLSLVSAEVKRA